ncbi:MAG: hypothetical protein JWO82_3164, partial [Akkermansiaceae bacterium]|nr:hypothetical protein [Akkermansiaceae bacterium]
MKSKSVIKSRMGLLPQAALACVAAMTIGSVHAEITTVFYILLENRCFTSGTETSYNNVLYNNKNGGSPYLTSLC